MDENGTIKIQGNYFSIIMKLKNNKDNIKISKTYEEKVTNKQARLTSGFSIALLEVKRQ